MENIMIPKTQKPVMASFGAAVAEKRRLLGISQETLAERVEISQESLSRIEKGFIAHGLSDCNSSRMPWSAPSLICFACGVVSERAATIEKILSSLSDDQQKEIVGIVATVARLATAR